MRLPHELVEVDLMKGAHKVPDFVRLSPFGQEPVFDDKGTKLFDSNAILVYLATKYDTDHLFLPRGPKGQAEVPVWLSVAASQVAFDPAAASLNTVLGSKYNPEAVIGMSV